MTQYIALPTAGLIVVHEDKLLLAYSKNKQAWYLPGGKIDSGETSQAAIQREIHEELDLILNEARLSYLCHISAPAYGKAKNIMMEQDCFLYDLQQDKISANHEIDAIAYFSLAKYQTEAIQVPGVLMVYAFLQQHGFL